MNRNDNIVFEGKERIRKSISKVMVGLLIGLLTVLLALTLYFGLVDCFYSYFFVFGQTKHEKNLLTNPRNMINKSSYYSYYNII